MHPKTPFKGLRILAIILVSLYLSTNTNSQGITGISNEAIKSQIDSLFNIGDFDALLEPTGELYERYIKKTDTTSVDFLSAMYDYAYVMNEHKKDQPPLFSFKDVLEHGLRHKIVAPMLLNVWRNYAFQFYFTSTQQDKGIAIMEEGIAWGKENNLEKTPNMFSVLSSMTKMHSRIHNREQALEVAKYALEIVESDSVQYYDRIPHHRMELAVMTKNASMSDDAEPIFAQAIEESIALENYSTLVECLAGQMQNYIDKGEYIKAEKSYSTMCEVLDTIDEKQWFKEIHLAFGTELYSSLGAYDKAMAINKRSIIYFSKNDGTDKNRWIRSKRLEADLLLKVGQTDQAIEKYREVYALNVKHHRSTSNRTLASLYYYAKASVDAKSPQAKQQLLSLISIDTVTRSDLSFRSYLLLAEYGRNASDIEMQAIARSHMDALVDSDYPLSPLEYVSYLLFKSENQNTSIKERLESAIKAKDAYINLVDHQYAQMTVGSKLEFRSQTNNIINNLRRTFAILSKQENTASKHLSEINFVYTAIGFPSSGREADYLSQLSQKRAARYLSYKRKISSQILKHQKDGLHRFQDTVAAIEKHIAAKGKSNADYSLDVQPYLNDSSTILQFSDYDENGERDILTCTIVDRLDCITIELSRPWNGQNIITQLSPSLKHKQLIIAHSSVTRHINFHSVIKNDTLLSNRFDVSIFNINNYHKHEAKFLNEKILLIGNISYETDQPDGTPQLASLVRSGFGNLPFAAEEMLFLEGLFPSKTSLQEDLATPSAALSHLANQAHTLLHVASHGYIVDSTFSSDMALINSGLVCSKAPDGRHLSAYEINNSDMSQIKLAVLASCNSALGEIMKEDGVYGLQKAFLNGGVQNLIVATQEIDDRQAFLFTKQLYTHLVENGNTIRESYNLAIDWLRDTQSSEDWQYFILIGDGSARLETSSSIGKWTIPLLSFLGLSSLVFMLYRKRKTVS